MMPSKNGLLLVRIVEARNLHIPISAIKEIETSVRKYSTALAGYATSVAWWFPYVVVEFDRNELQVDAYDGDLRNPIWKYRATLYPFATY